MGSKCVLDVRENPFSRKPGFSKRPLSQALEANGIRYVHLKELGTPHPLRDAVKAGGDYGVFFRQIGSISRPSQRPSIEPVTTSAV